MNYIGSKLSLLNFLDDSINKVADKKSRIFCDLFAGTGIVGSYFKKKGYKIISNDIQYYSYVLNKQYIKNHKELEFNKLETVVPEISSVSISKRKDLVCKYLSEIKGTDGFIFENYCLGGTNNQVFERQYFSDENGRKCDAIRMIVEDWKNNDLINDDEYYFLLATLIESVDKKANTAAVYGAFLKKLKKTAQSNFVLNPAELIINDTEHEVYNLDANELLKNIRCDILYLDPPYNHRQYSTNYHLLETIARYDNPKIHGKTGLRDYSKQKSLFCSRVNVKKAFKELILGADAKYIFLSYNNEGLLSIEDIKEIMSLRGEYGHFEKEYPRFKADKDENREHKQFNKTTEYLHYVVCK